MSRYIAVLVFLLTSTAQSFGATPECQASFDDITNDASGYALTIWATDEALDRPKSDMPRNVFELAFRGAGFTPDKATIAADDALKSVLKLVDRDPMTAYIRDVVKTKKYPPELTERLLLEQESKLLDELKVGLAKLRTACGTSEDD
jgi:hypothetical protein